MSDDEASAKKKAFMELSPVEQISLLYDRIESATKRLDSISQELFDLHNGLAEARTRGRARMKGEKK